MQHHGWRRAKSERLEFALRDHDRQHRIAKMRLADSGREIEHVGASRRAEVFLLHLEIAGEIVFQVRMVAAKSVFSNLIGAGVEIGNEDARVVAALAADNLAASQRVCPAQSCAVGQFRDRSNALLKQHGRRAVRCEPMRADPTCSETTQ